METKLVLDGTDAHAVTSQDVEDILEYNKFLRGEEQRSDCWRHTASIPNVIIERWLNEEHARGNLAIQWGSKEFDLLVQKKLKDPDWAYLRVDKPALITGWLGFGS